MLLNEKAALLTTKVLLVPYCKYHVPIYHAWMKDPSIQEATASEPLTIDEEYGMQESWRRDSDKLTFIICAPVLGLEDGTTSLERQLHDTNENMIGDVNMFITTYEDIAEEPSVVGELELMVATAAHQGKGYGRSALLSFLRYITDHENEIVAEFSSSSDRSRRSLGLSCLCAKIGEQNLRSIGLFESLGFVKTSTQPSYFGEFELKRQPFSAEAIENLLAKYKIEAYSELTFGADDG